MKNLFIFLALLVLALSSCGAESNGEKQSKENWPTSGPSISEPPGPPPY